MIASLSSRARRALTVGVLSGAGLLVAAACSAGTASSTAARTPASAAIQSVSHPAPSIAVGQSSRGPIVVDKAGRTLYRYDKDTPGSGTSTCTGACAQAWPPAIVTGEPTAAPGVGGALSLITRPDGTHQLALDGHPLYRYVGDQGQGDTTGDGFGGIWHVLHPSARSSAAGASTGGGGSSSW
jgi:predicted lipoprotein with Yx(FWY)xxD motif